MPKQKSLNVNNKQTNQSYLFVSNCSDFDRTRTVLLEFHWLIGVVITVKERGKSIEEDMRR